MKCYNSEESEDIPKKLNKGIGEITIDSKDYQEHPKFKKTLISSEVNSYLEDLSNGDVLIFFLFSLSSEHLIKD